MLVVRRPLALTRPASRGRHRAVNACLAPLYSVEGCAVTTVEGLGSTRAGLHPVQSRLAKSHGSQCGFCTPGFVMSMYSLLRSSAVRRTPTAVPLPILTNRVFTHHSGQAERGGD